jgi:hypothetical protein
VLLCAPSLGILDNWLPVLHAARRLHPHWRIVALLPDRGTLAQLDPDDTAHVLADEAIDATVAPLVGGGWILTEGFLGAVDAARPRRPLPRWPTRAQRRLRIQLSQLGGAHARLLYDVHLHGKERIRPLLEAMGDTPRFSHNHGIELESDDPTQVGPSDPENVRCVLAYGPSEVAPYAANFAIGPSRVRPVGVLRHADAWVEKVVRASEERHELPFERFATVISRPSGSPYLPRDRKVANLVALRRVCWEEHGIPLVLRLHPKEQEEGTIEEALPSHEEGVGWARSSAHPFHLATRSVFGITFLSGVTVDLVALGVPVVQLLDIRGLGSSAVPPSASDAQGRPLFGPYARDGLTHAVHDESGLREFVAGVLLDPGRSLAPLSERLRTMIPSPTPATDIVDLLAG